MITISREEKAMKITLEGGPLNYSYHLRFQCGEDCYAELLTKHFREKFHDLVENIRREEYEKGYKDGRAKRGKRSWFSSLLKLGQ